MSRKSRSRSSSAGAEARAPVSPPGLAPGLVCPSCGALHAADERFCRLCRMPLVVAGDAAAAERPVSEAHAHARKIRPEYARGELVRVAGGRNQAEAELIHGFLLEEGIPSIVRRSAAFDVPDFLAAGQRDVLVPSSGAGAARELLTGVELAASGGDRPAPGVTGARAASVAHPVRLVAAIAGGGLAAALVAWALTQGIG